MDSILVLHVEPRRSISDRNESFDRFVKGREGSVAVQIRRRCLVCKQANAFVLLVAIATVVPQLASAADAQSAVPFRAQGKPSHAGIELIADQATTSSKAIWVGVLFHLDPGWHVYWENAGDSGTPPKIDWQLPAPYHAGAIRWPVPVRLGHGSVVDYGYEGEVLLMAPIEPASAPPEKAGSPQNGMVAISADVKYVVCSDVCIPGKTHPRLLLSFRSDGANSPLARWHTIFERTRAQLPKAAPGAWKISAASEKNDFVLSARTGTPIKTATFFPVDADEIENSAPQAFRSTSDGFQLTLPKSNQLTKPISTLRGLVVVGFERAFEVAAPVTTR
jgi:DsbC/DsbD-like thiol-disulfide interchange protein